MKTVNQSHLNVLDYLKAFAVIGVILTHISLPLKEIYFPFWGHMSVPIFIIISGYVWSLSAYSNGIDTIKKWFFSKLFVRYFWRILMPFLVLFGAEIVYFHLPPERWFSLLLQGGKIGSGNYYIPILFQMLALFAFLRFFVQKGIFFIALILAVNVGFEYYVVTTHMPNSLYRLLFFRYFSFFCAGMILYRYKIPPLYMLLCSVLGVGYIYLIQYAGYKLPLFNLWKETSLPTVLYACPIVYLFLSFKDKLRWDNDVILKIGQSTYWIYLVQIFFFMTVKLKTFTPWERVFISLSVCLLSGVLLNEISNRFARLFKPKQ